MPKHKNRQFDFNGNEDESATGSDQGTSSSRKKKGNNGKARNYYEAQEDGAATTSTKVRSVGAGDFTKATEDTIQYLTNTHEKLDHLAVLYEKYIQDIQEASENRRKVLELENLCSVKDAMLGRFHVTLDTMQKVNLEKEEKLKQERTEIEQDRKGLKAEIDNLAASKDREERRLKVKDAERKHNLEEELKKLKAAHEQAFKEKLEKLESDLKKRDDERKKELASLEADNKNLSKQLKEIEAKNSECVKALATEKERYQDMENSRTIFRDKAQRYKGLLEGMRNEFGLGNNTPEHYQAKFAEISEQISVISTRYCRDLDPKEWAPIHVKLKALDSCFASIPISGSKDSKMLRIAHVQRIISFHLSSIILQPFSSDCTFQSGRRDAVALLEEALLGLNQCGYGKRAATVFKALAVRGLQSVQNNPVASPSPSPKSSATRIEAFVLAVMPIMSLLVPKPEHAGLEASLVTLANSAISVWNSAQTEELLQIGVSLELDQSHRMDWRSTVFDPEDGGADGPFVFSTHPRIFTLFPVVIGKGQSPIAETVVINVPGSFEESHTEPLVHEFYIHHGIGMAESSALVLRGKEEQEQKEEDEEDERLRQDVENKQRRLEERNKIKSQRTGSTSGSPSPTSTWSKFGGNKISPEE